MLRLTGKQRSRSTRVDRRELPAHIECLLECPLRAQSISEPELGTGRPSRLIRHIRPEAFQTKRCSNVLGMQ
jgi:hypothetical protein